MHSHDHPVCYCRGLSLRACEDVDDAAVILLSKYTAAKHDLIPDFSKMDVASNSPADSLQHTPGSLNKTAALVTPTFRNVSLQRSMLGSNLVGLRKAEAPSNPNQHLLPLLDAEAAVLTQGSSSSEPGLRQHQPSHQGKGEKDTISRVRLFANGQGIKPPTQITSTA